MARPVPNQGGAQDTAHLGATVGKRPDPGSEEFGDRDSGRAHDALHDAAASPDGWPWGDTACEERPGPGRARG